MLKKYFPTMLNFAFISALMLITGCKSEISFEFPSQKLDQSIDHFAPKNLSLLALSSSSIDLNWNPSISASESGYKIAYNEGDQAPGSCELGTIIATTDITGTSHQIDSLEPLKKYAFRVCALDGQGDEVSSKIIISDVLRPTKIYRSVGPDNTSFLSQGSPGNTLRIEDSVAYFELSLAGNIGVGDAVLIDRNDNSDFDADDEVVFIYERDPNSSPANTIYTVKTVSGETPDDFDAPSSYWAIYRAYTQASSAERANENSGIDADLRNFDTWTNGRDMVANDEQWEFAIYGDGANGTLRFRDWISSPAHYLRVFAPHLPTEVGMSQRHSGVWDNTKARFISSDYFGTINNENEETAFNHLRLDGLLVENSRSDGTGNGGGLNFDDFDRGVDDNGVLYVQNCLVKKTLGSWSAYEQAGLWVNTDRISKVVVTNNVFTGFAKGIFLGTKSNITVEIYNNTIDDSMDAGIRLSDGGSNETFRIKNNLVVNTGQDYNIGPSVTLSDYSNNLSSDSTAVGLNSVTNSIISFVDPTIQDYRLDSSDTDAISQGVDMSQDTNYPFDKDIRGITRSTWDIGAFRF